MITRNGITLFFSYRDAFSHFHPVSFEVKGISFCCGEQFLMYCKARLFGDTASADAILQTSNPHAHKRYGRAVKPFDAALWSDKSVHYATIGNRARFTQNPRLKSLLLATGNTVIAEASPYDRIWGIGFAPENPLALSPAVWGENRLGKILMRIRAEFHDQARTSKHGDRDPSRLPVAFAVGRDRGPEGWGFDHGPFLAVDDALAVTPDDGRAVVRLHPPEEPVVVARAVEGAWTHETAMV